MNKHAAPDAIWFKGQRVWRTLISGALSLLSVVPAVLMIVNDQWPSELWAAVAAQILGVQSVVTRVMAIDSVNSFLTRFGLGSTPRAHEDE